MQDTETVQRRPGVLGVHSLDHFAFTVPDLATAQAFYRNFGLDARAEGDKLALYTFGHEHRWGVLEEARGKNLQHLTFGVFEDDLPRFRAKLDQLGITRIAPPPGSGGNGIWFHDNDGNKVELCVAEKCSANTKSRFEAISCGPGVAGAVLRDQVPVIRPRRMSHVAIFATDIERTIAFYTAVLGLRLSDKSGGGVAFLHGAHGSDHHMLAIVKSDRPGFHHCSWDVGSVNDVGLGAMQMAEKGHTAGWGVGRHVLGSNYFHYVRDPWGSYSEYSADMDYIPATTDWNAGDHDPANAMFLWGPAPPPDFITNFEEGK
jgi:catechol 2,3-dioxygenase